LTHRSWVARMRYEGQGHELDVPLTLSASNAPIAAAFEAAHRGRFGFTLSRPMEVVSLRHVAQGAARTVTFSGKRKARARAVTGPTAIALSDATLFVAKGWRATESVSAGWRLERR
jgi:N-methylhydantoinase A